MASQIDFDFPEDNPKQDYEAFHYRWNNIKPIFDVHFIDLSVHVW
jgi:hypothetical protein